MSILDQFGRTISAAEIRRLREPVATPTLAGVRPVISGHPADGMTPAKLARILRAADQGDSQQYMELAEEIEERDPHYASVLATRKRAVSQLPITVVAHSDDPKHVAHKDFVQQWIDTGLLRLALFDMLDAIGKGYSVCEIEWGAVRNQLQPVRISYRPQRWFEVAPEDGDTIKLREGVSLEPLSPHKFIVHRHPSKSGLVVRSGIARSACMLWMLKAFTARDWAVFIQNYGQPVRVGKYGPESSQEDREVLWSAVANIAGDCAAIIPRSMEIEFIETGDMKANAGAFKDRSEYLERLISKLVLGQTTTTDAVSGGHAVAQEHRLVQGDIERADAMLLSATLTQQLVRPLVDFNFTPQDAYPTILIGRPDEVSLPILVDALAKLLPQGLRVEASEVRDRLGLSEPGKRPDGSLDPAVEIIGGVLPAPAPSAEPVLPAPPPPAIPRLARHLISLHASQPEPEFVGRLTDDLALDAQGALSGLTDQVREVLMSAEGYDDLLERLDALQLDPREMSVAMTRAMALAHLVGRAAVLDELQPGGGRAR